MALSFPLAFSLGPVNLIYKPFYNFQMCGHQWGSQPVFLNFCKVDSLEIKGFQMTVALFVFSQNFIVFLSMLCPNILNRITPVSHCLQSLDYENLLAWIRDLDFDPNHPTNTELQEILRVSRDSDTSINSLIHSGSGGTANE